MTRQELEIFLKLRADTSQVKGLTSALGGVRGALTQITGMQGGLTGVLAGLTGGAVIAGMKRLTEQAVILSGVIEKNRATLGLAAAQTQVFSAVLKDAGGTGDEFVGAISRIQKAVGDADPVIGRLGLSISTLRRQSGGEQLESVAVALSKVANESERASLSAEILGRSYSDLRPLLDALAKRGFPALQEEVRRSRGLLSDFASKELDDAVDRQEAATQKIAIAMSGVRIQAEKASAAVAEYTANLIANSKAEPAKITPADEITKLQARIAELSGRSDNISRQAIFDLQDRIAGIEARLYFEGRAQRVAVKAPAANRNSSIRSGVQGQLDLLAEQNAIAAQNEQFARNVFSTQVDAYLAEGKAKVFEFYQTIRTQITEGDRIQKALRIESARFNVEQELAESQARVANIEANRFATRREREALVSAELLRQNGLIQKRIDALKEQIRLETDASAKFQMKREVANLTSDQLQNASTAGQYTANPNSADFRQGITQLKDSFISAGAAGAQVASAGFNGLVDQLTQAIVLTGDLGMAFDNLKRLLLTEVVGAIVRMGAQWVATHLIMKGVSIAWHALLSALGWKQVADTNAQEAAKTPALATNAGLASAGSFGTSAILGLAALLALMAVASSFEYGTESTGSGPRSGGLDGKGGFLAILHPQERIIDDYHNTMGNIRLPAQPTARYNESAPTRSQVNASASGAASINIASFNTQTEAETYLRSRAGTSFLHDQVKQVIRSHR